MRTKFQIVLIIFTITSLYIIRTDVIKAYNIVSNFVINEYDQAIKVSYPTNTNSDSSENVNSSSTANTGTSEAKSESALVIGIHKLTDTPGALRVANAVLGQDGALTVKGVIGETNMNRRTVSGLPDLIENERLNNSAQKKVEDMFNKQYFEHVSPSGVGVSDLADEQGYEFIIIGENLALGNFKNDEAVVTAWMNSPGHRANILNTKYTEIGVAVQKGTFEGKEVWLAVQHFGLPKDTCPLIDQVLKAKIQLNQKKINSMQRELSTAKKNIDSGGVYGGKTTQEQIDIYNSQVNIYNDLISQNKIDIEAYNKTVKAFNACVQSNI